MSNLISSGLMRGRSVPKFCLPLLFAFFLPSIGIADTEECQNEFDFVKSLNGEPKVIECIAIDDVGSPPRPPGYAGGSSTMKLAPRYAHRTIRELIERINQLTHEYIKGGVPSRTELNALKWDGDASEIVRIANLEKPADPFYQKNGYFIDLAFAREASAVYHILLDKVSKEEAGRSLPKNSTGWSKGAVWYASRSETKPTCHLGNKVCQCRFDDMISALSRTWGPPLGRGGRNIVTKFSAMVRAHSPAFPPSAQLRGDADEIVSFVRADKEQQLNILGKNKCVIQTVQWTPLGPVVQDVEQFVLTH